MLNLKAPRFAVKFWNLRAVPLRRVANLKPGKRKQLRTPKASPWLQSFEILKI